MHVRQHPGNVQPVLVGLALGVMIGVLAMDVLFPFGAVPGLLYVSLVMLSVASKRRFLTFLAATAFTAVIAYDLTSMFPDYRTIPWRILARFSFLLVAIWVPALATLATAYVELHVEQMNAPLHLCPSCKKIRDDQGAWSKIEDFVSEKLGRPTSSGFCPRCVGRWVTSQGYQEQ